VYVLAGYMTWSCCVTWPAEITVKTTR